MSVVVVSGAWTTPTPSSTATLKSKVARLYGLEGDADAEALALDFLDEVVMELNTGLYEFNLVRQESIALTEGTQSYVLQENFFKEKSAFLVKTSSGQQQIPLAYLDWATFRRKWGETDSGHYGRPSAYSAFNPHTEGSIYLARIPNATTASDYTLTVEYYRRITLPSAASSLNIPPEVENAILYGAYKRMAMHIQGAGHPDVPTFEVMYQKSLSDIEGQDDRHPDELTRFRIVDGRFNRGRGSKWARWKG